MGHRLRNHSYSCSQIHLCIQLVLEGALSFRGSSKAVELCFESFGFDFPAPSFSSVRLWIQRLGYYKLTASREKSDDYLWILDHTIQLESMKVLLILGIRLKDLPPVGEALSIADMEPIALFPVEKSKGEVVYQQLEASAERTGIPRAILSDAGSDLKKGAELFCEHYPQTEFLYDITHKSACLLKRYLEKDEVWLYFCSLVASSRKSLQQTSLSYLIPPVFKNKARYMNLENIITWGNRLIVVKKEILVYFHDFSSARNVVENNQGNRCSGYERGEYKNATRLGRRTVRKNDQFKKKKLP